MTVVRVVLEIRSDTVVVVVVVVATVAMIVASRQRVAMECAATRKDDDADAVQWLLWH